MHTNARHTGIALLGVLLAGLTLSYSAAAGVSTKQNSATDPDYIGFQFSTVVIRIQSDDADSNTVLGHFLARELGKRGVTAYLYDEVFPATQSWNDENMRLVREELSIDGTMLVQRVSEAYNTKSISTSATHTQRVRYSATSMPTRSDQPSGRYGGGPVPAVSVGEGVSGSDTGAYHAQNAQYQVVLVDWTQGREVWRLNIETRVTGYHSRHQQMGKGTAQGIIQGLTDSQHIPQK